MAHDAGFEPAIHFESPSQAERISTVPIVRRRIMPSQVFSLFLYCA